MRGLRNLLVRSGTACLIAAMSVALAAGCKKAPADDDMKTQPAAKPKPAVPKDYADKGSLPPGTDKAFALVLPFGFNVQTRLDRTAAAMGMAQSKQVVNYIKERVRDGKVIETDPERVVFEGVRIPDEPDRYLQIVVTNRNAATLITVTDVTPAPAIAPTSQSERYKQVGLAPNGQLLHPHTIE